MNNLPNSTEQPIMEQKGKKVAQDQGSKTDKMEQDNYTRPPRVSFGIELEFLVARNTDNVPDVDKDVPGIAPATYMSGRDAVKKLLQDHGFCVSGYAAHSSSDQLWIVTRDGSVSENFNESTRQIRWDPVEISSPPLYSSEEAYNLISAVVRLLTTNLRVRVNTTCGFHVHVGNGPHQLDLRALRNYAALLWASEPALSTLHCPTRSFAYWSKSIRRRHGINFVKGLTANEAHRQIMSRAPRMVPRFISRARKFGESPAASYTALRQHLRVDDDNELMLKLTHDDDESDWEDTYSKPFERPKRPKGPRHEELGYEQDVTLFLENQAALSDSQSTRRELPPQIAFPVSEIMASGTSLGLSLLLEDKREKKKPISFREVDTLPQNRWKIDSVTQNNDGPVDLDAIEANTKLAWKGVAEFLACDIGAHQLAYLLTDCKIGWVINKGYTSNWMGQLPGDLSVHRRERMSNPTIECRLAAGTLDAEWIVTWAKIQCRLLEWARDADPAQFMNVIGKLSRDDHSQECTYDVLDFLRDIGMYTELKCCRERLRRCEEAWYECMLMKPPPSPVYNTTPSQRSNYDPGLSFSIEREDE
ncbi:hypothetical protein FPOAC2_01341 [Fusarium poae]|uniref:hypothetical protein n=1 Tax=Fusarium poae TaxID=36050 RepID=UPI001CE9C8A2|nr:hypothetical protein FPOAC1_001269 [Fusarium poae]KAG8675291.1 hypothetical protein FPOAC1_001269 [Fusarium poae]